MSEILNSNVPPSSEKKPGFVAVSLSWFFGVFFLLATLGAIVGTPPNILGAFCMATIGVILLPPTHRFIEQTIKMRVTRGVKTAQIIVLLMVFGATDPHQSRTAVAEKAAPRDPAAVAKMEPAKETHIKESCRQLSDMFDTRSGLSDLQKEEIWKRYEGKTFKWDVEVVEVSSNVFGGYTVQLKCRNSRSLIQDVHMSFPASAKGQVIGLLKGNLYKISGLLKTQSSLLGISAEAI